ncbi:hypothetical protein LOD99_5854 [Oopsacas minuta]|uniref:Large ribosomal subunit protein uL22m n=1 Tax=Oopsacas minuta TaxID=111878 RepID=A0AAV7JN70_9METZ|nr:hypothetical protein LOD99_5854 [Oopsacas minuta]
MALSSLFQSFSKLSSHHAHLIPPKLSLKIITRNLDLTLNRGRDLPDPQPPKVGSIFPYPPIKKSDVVFGVSWNVQQPPKTVNRVARLIRDLDVKMALIQLQFCEIRSSRDVYTTVVETFNRAKKRFGEVDPADVWVHKSHIGRGVVHKSLRYRAKGRADIERRKFTHYFLVLKLGKPPDRTLKPRPTKAQFWLNKPPERISLSLYPGITRYETLEERLGPKLSKNIDRDMPHAL